MINSFGYPTTIAPGSVFARYTRLAGHPWAFETESGFRVARVTTGSTRRVTVQAGWLQAAGILIQNTAAETLDVPAPTGASQYWLLVMRLWVVDGATYRSEFAWVAGAPLQAEQNPATTQTIGTQFDVPIALCYVTSAAALVQNVLDCRIVANSGGGVQIYEDFMLAQMRFWYGTTVYNVNNGILRMIARNAAESEADYKRLVTTEELDTVANVTNFGSSASGWATGSTTGYDSDAYRNAAGMVQLTLFCRTSKVIDSSSSGNVADEVIFTITDNRIKPRDYVTGNLNAYNASGTTCGGLVMINPQGEVQLRSLDIPNFTLRRVSGEPSLFLGLSYMGRAL